MIGTALGIAAMAALFVVAGLLRLGADQGCSSGHCHSCSHDCEFNTERRLP